MEGNHHSRFALLDDRLRNQLHGGKETVDEIRPFRQHLVLAAPVAARSEERLRVLKVVMVVRIVPAVADRRSDDVPLRQRRTVMNRYGPDLVRRAVDDHRLEPAFLIDLLRQRGDGDKLLFVAECQMVNLVHPADNGELSQVYGISSFAENRPLRSLLATLLKKLSNVGKVSIRYDAGKSLAGIAHRRVPFAVSAQRLPVSSKHVTDPAPMDGDQPDLVDPVLVTGNHVEAASQDFRLKSCF